MKGYLRGEVAKKAGINIETLRFYERKGLIPVPQRLPNGYRVYKEETLMILEFIKNAKSAGFSLEQIRKLFGAINGENLDVEYVDKLIDKKMREIDTKIRELKSVTKNLQEIKANLYEPHECPLANAFKNSAESE